MEDLTSFYEVAIDEEWSHESGRIDDKSVIAACYLGCFAMALVRGFQSIRIII
jgi:hypothetical protein